MKTTEETKKRLWSNCSEITDEHGLPVLYQIMRGEIDEVTL